MAHMCCCESTALSKQRSTTEHPLLKQFGVASKTFAEGKVRLPSVIAEKFFTLVALAGLCKYCCIFNVQFS